MSRSFVFGEGGLSGCGLLLLTGLLNACLFCVCCSFGSMAEEKVLYCLFGFGGVSFWRGLVGRLAVGNGKGLVRPVCQLFVCKIRGGYFGQPGLEFVALPFPLECVQFYRSHVRICRVVELSVVVGMSICIEGSRSECGLRTGWRGAWELSIFTRPFLEFSSVLHPPGGIPFPRFCRLGPGRRCATLSTGHRQIWALPS